jgi:uncharacterized damage-inducible protein DinB
MSDRIAALESTAPDVVACWRALEEGRPIGLRREVRRRAGAGTAPGMADQLAAVAQALAGVVETLPDEAFLLPGGEADWSVTQTLGHDADARAGLAMAASLAAQGRFPADAPTVVPGVPGRADADRASILAHLATSQRIVTRAARAVAGHETDPCPLDHPLVGRLRCGEWLLFAGVHDLMHLEQLEAIEAQLAADSSNGPSADSSNGTPAVGATGD